MKHTVQIDLQFNANTTLAKNSMQELQTILTSLSTQSASMPPLSITPQLQQAEQSAMRLKIALNNAFNQDTGKLNLVKFQSELNRAGLSLKTLSTDLRMLGPTGIQAFQQMTQQIVAADTRLFSLSGKAKSLVDTLGSAVKWSIAYQGINMVTSGFRDTINYAKDLDKSLNNIRIVTGKSANDMSRFAKQANIAAKELSTTTKAYTDASLIYFQQGLSENEVKKRTDTTVKLANVTGESAETVSNWMTAIWNNFADGSDNLEYYADVITKLGAATASSADEIAGGLEKFAAVGETVGLSFEYATSALATITAETRQSEEVVGTALKTLFARMEGLSLGETLEDGTTLNKYSNALAAVGVSIKDTTGQIKNMDTILDETGVVWQTLAQDQKIALAQTVAGVRQYTQFMALMDNWDIMERNVQMAKSSAGVLQSQQEIFEDSLEASQKRMQTSAEKFKNTLLSADQLKPLYSFGAGTLDLLAEMLESFGGLRTIILGVVAALTKMYQPQLESWFSNIASSFALMGKGAAKFKKEAITLNASMLANQNQVGDDLATRQSVHSKQQADLQLTLLANSKNITEVKKQEFQWRMQIIEAQQKEIEQAAANLELEKDKLLTIQEQAQSRSSTTNKEAEDLTQQATNYGKGMRLGEHSENYLNAATKGLNDKDLTLKNRQEISSNTMDLMSQSGAAYKQMGVDLNSTELKGQFGAMVSDTSAFMNKTKSVEEGGQGLSAYDAALDSLQQEFNEGTTTVDQFKQKIEEINRIMSEIGGKTLQDSKDKAIVGTELTNSNQQRAFNMANLSEVSTIDDMQAAVGNRGNFEIQDINGKTTTFNQEAESITNDTATNQTNLKQSQEELVKAENELAEARKMSNTDLKKTGKTLADYEKKVNDAKKAVNKHTAELKKLDKRTDHLRKETKKYGNELRNQQILEKKGTRTSEEIASSNEEAAISVNNLTEAAQKHGAAVADEDANVRQLDNDVNKLKGDMTGAALGTGGFANGLAKSISTIASYAMGLSMITGAFESLNTSLAEGNTSWQDWLSFISSSMMSLGMFIPLIVQTMTSIGNLTKARRINTIATQAGVAVDKTSLIIDKLQHGASKQEIIDEYGEAGAKVMNALGENTKNAAQGPWGWTKYVAGLAMILPIAAMVGVSAVSGAQKGAANKEEKEKEERAETADKAKEVVDATKEERESQKELTTSYYDLIEVYKETGKGKDDIVAKAKEIAEAFNDESIAAIALTGDYDALTEAIQKAELASIASQKNKYKTSLNQQQGAYTDDFRATEEGYMSGNNMHAQFFVGDSNYRNDEKAMMDALSEGLALYDTEGLIKLEEFVADADGKGKTVINLKGVKGDKGEQQDLIKRVTQYAVNKVSGDLGEEANDSETYNSAIKFLSGIEERGGAYSETVDAIKEAEIAEAILTTDKDITKYGEFNALYSELMNKYGTTEEGALMVSQAMSTYGDKDYAFLSQGVNNLKKQMGVVSESVKAKTGRSTRTITPEEIDDWIANADSETQKAIIAIGNDPELLEKYFTDSTTDFTDLIEEKKKETSAATAATAFSELEFDEKAAENYVEYLKEINPALKEETTLLNNIATNTVKAYKGMQNLAKTWKDAGSKLQGVGNTLEKANAVAQVSNGLLDMFGIDHELYGEKVSKVIKEQTDDVVAMMNGSAQGLKNVQTNIAKEIAGNNDAALDMINKLTSKNYGYGSEIQEGQWFDDIISAMEAGTLTRGDVDSIFKTLGWTGSWSETNGALLSVTKTLNEAEFLQGQLDELNKRQKEHEKYLRDENDLYYEQDQIIEELNTELDRLSDAKDRAYGPDKIKLIEDEINKNKELIKTLKDKEEIGEKELRISQKELSSLYNFEFDKDGKISNWAEIQNKELAELDRIGEATGFDGEVYKKAKEQYQEKKDAKDRYNEDYDIVKDTQQEIIDKQNEIIDLSYENVEYSIEYKIDIEDRKLELIEYHLSKIEDDAFSGAEKIKLLGDSIDIATNKLNINRKGIYDLLEALTYSDGITKQFTKEEIERLLNGDMSVLEGKELTEKLIDQLTTFSSDMVSASQDIDSNFKEMEESILSEIEGWNEEFEKQNQLLEYHTNLIDNYKNIVDIVGKNQFDKDFLQTLRDSEAENAKALIISARAQADALKSSRDEAKKLLDDAIANSTYEDPEKDPVVQSAKRIFEEIDAQWREGEITSMEMLTSGLEILTENFKSSVEDIVEVFSEGVSGIYKNIEELSKAFERQQEVSGRYLKDYEKTYQISRLNRQIEQSIDKTDNVAAQKELKSLQQELNRYSADNVKMNKYDLEYLQKKYDLMLAEQAFRDAQNTKNQVMLQRDSQGNYSYIYKANQNNIDQTMQALEDKQFAMADWQAQSEQELTQNFISILQKYEEEILALAEKYGEDSDEFRYYSTLLLEQFNEDKNDALAALQNFAENAGIEFKELLIGQMYPDIRDFTELSTNLDIKLRDSINTITSAFNNLKAFVDIYLGKSGLTTKGIQEFAEQASKDLKSVTTEASEVAAAVLSISDAMDEQLKTSIQGLSDWHTKLAEQVQPVTDTCEKIAEAISLITGAYKDLKEAENGIESDVSDVEQTPIIDGDRTSLYSNVEGDPNNPMTNTTPHKVIIKAKPDGITKRDSHGSYYLEAEDGQFYLRDTEYYDSEAKEWAFNSQKIKNTQLWGPGTKEWKPPKTPTIIANPAPYYSMDGGTYGQALVYGVPYQIKQEHAFDWTEIDKIIKEEGLSVNETNRNLIKNSWFVNDLNANNKRVMIKAANGAPIPYARPNVDGSIVDNNTYTNANGTKFRQGSKFQVYANKFPDINGQILADGYGINGSTVIYTSMMFDMADWPRENGRYTATIQSIKNSTSGYLVKFKEDDGWFIANNFSSYGTITTFDTGGYTGSWGPEGRMAMLHQKEIVLNAHDTENLLTVVGIVRSMVDQLEANTKLASYGLGQLTARTIGVSSDTLQQEVTIHAEFPNATDHNEIEEAFRNLTNLASQYANRK